MKTPKSFKPIQSTFFLFNNKPPVGSIYIKDQSGKKVRTKVKFKDKNYLNPLHNLVNALIRLK